LINSDKTVHNDQFSDDQEGEQEKWIATLLDNATKEEEICEVKMDNLLLTAMMVWEEPRMVIQYGSGYTIRHTA
jgi:hypothetical protein